MSSPLTFTITERVAVNLDGPSEAETVSNFAKSLFLADENSIETQLNGFYARDENRMQLLGDLLYCIATDTGHDIKEKFKLITRLLSIEPMPMALLDVLTDTPDRFIAIFKMIDDNELSTRLFNYFIEQKGLFALVWIVQVAVIITELDLSSKTRQYLLEDLMYSLSADSFDEFVDVCFNDLPLEKLAHILLYLKNKEILQAFIEKILDRYDGEDLPRACLTLIGRMFRFIQADTPFCPAFLRELLHYKANEGWAKKAILDKLLDYPDNCQSCIIWGCPSDLLLYIFDHYADVYLHAKWAEDILVLEADFDGKIKRMKDFLNYMNSDQVLALARTLVINAEGLPDGYSLAIPYLTLELCTAAFGDFVGYEALDRKNLLDLALPLNRHEARYLIAHISPEQRARILSIIGTPYLVTDPEPLDGENDGEVEGDGGGNDDDSSDGGHVNGEIATMTVDALGGEMAQIITHFGAEEVYVKQKLEQIPPFLLALALSKDNHKAWILKTAVFLTEEQLRALGTCFPSDNLMTDLKALFTTLQSQQFFDVLENLPQNLQLTYMNSKANEIIDLLDDVRVGISEIRDKVWELLLESLPKINLKKFLEFIRRLSKNDCFKALKKDELTTLLANIKKSEMQCVQFYINQRGAAKGADLLALYEEVQSMNFALLAKAGSALIQHFHILKKRVLSLDKSKLEANTTCLRIPYLMQQFGAISQNFKGPEGLITLIDLLKPVVVEEEISDAYWFLIPSGAPKYLKIDHAGIILELGIKTDQDFQCLGLPYQKQNFILNIRKTIEGFILKVIDALPDAAIPDSKDNKKQEDIKTRRKQLKIDLEELLKLSTDVQSTKLLEQLLNIFKCAEIPPEAATAWMVQILKEIKSVNMKTPEEENRLGALLHRLENAPEKDALKILCVDVLEFAVIFFKNNDFLERLKCYLSQPDLEKIWKLLHEKNIHSLSELMDLQMVRNLPDDFYRLAAVLNVSSLEKNSVSEK